MSAHDKPLLEADDLHLQRGGRDVVRGVNLDLHAGQVTALLGPNGAGKSTLLDGLAGALAPSAGWVHARGRVALALQSPDLARRSVFANVELALAWWGVPKAQRGARVREALADLAVAHLAQRPATALSGGERRRIHLARAVALRAEVLLLDEPFAGLDPNARAALLADAGAALRSPTSTTLVVVHDRAEAWAVADRLLVLIDGRVAADGPPRTLLENPPSAAVARFLGFDGSVTHGDRMLLTRPQHVMLDPDGLLSGRVSRVIPLEEGVRLELQLEAGRVYVIEPFPSLRLGDTVHVRLTGGVYFEGDGVPDPPTTARPRATH